MKYFEILILVLFTVSLSFSQDNTQQNESSLIKNTRQLIYEGLRSGEGYFSPDGKKLVFQSERETDNPFYQIYLLDFETGDINRVSPGIGNTTCAFIQNGTGNILFGSTHLDPQTLAKQKEEFEIRRSGKAHRYAWSYEEEMDIFVADANGKNIKRLTSAKGYDAEASFSPDGKKIVFCSLRNAYNGELNDKQKKQLETDASYFGELYIMNADGSSKKRLTNWSGYDGGPFFSPDGKRIIWRHFEENGHMADVYTMKLDGSDVQRLTDFKALSWAPYFHPSGEYVLFASNKVGFSNFEIYMVDALGQKEPVRVTNTDGFDGLPVFSPDGKKLCWTTNRTSDKTSQLFMGDWNHSVALKLLADSPLRNTPHAAVSGFSSKIDSNDFKSIVATLAADEMEGRMSGTEHTKRAADYIISKLQDFGLEPFGDNNTFKNKFEFPSGVELIESENSLKLGYDKEDVTFILNEDFRPLSFTENGKTEGQVVFAGYGLSIEGKPGEGYDSYAGLDVQDKVVVVLRYVPEDVSVERRQKLNMYAGLRYKAMIARDRGAKALLVVSGPNSPKAGELIPLNYDKTSAGSGILVATVSGAMVDKLFETVGKTLKDVQSELDIENPHFEGTFNIPDALINISCGVNKLTKEDENVVAILKSANNPKKEAVLIGGHYDHLGHGEAGSLAGKDEEGKIHNGADDNASGTSVVLELAAYFADEFEKNPEKYKKDVIFAFWSAEELGIIGSSSFVEKNLIPKEEIAAYINFDMVGRLKDNNLILQGIGSSSYWKKTIEKRNVVAGFNLTLQEDPFQPTDVTAFYPKGIPVLSFFTGSHEDYHRPSDDPQTLNYNGLERVAKFASLIVRDLAGMDERPDYLKVERVKSQQGSRESMRAYLGTIPDYVSSGDEGMKLTGVSGGGPADKAGLQSGDIIIELAGQTVKNIYDYTYAIDALKIGQTVDVVILRDQEKITLKITPQARD